MTRHLLQVLHDADVADASSDASCAAANLLSLQLNLLDLHMPNDSSFNYRVESAHFSIAHRFHRAATLRLRSCRYLAASLTPSAVALCLCLCLSRTDCPRMPEQFCTAHCTKINLQRFVCLHKPPVAEFPLPLSRLSSPWSTFLPHSPDDLQLSACSPLVARGPALNIAVRFSCL